MNQITNYILSTSLFALASCAEHNPSSEAALNAKPDAEHHTTSLLSSNNGLPVEWKSLNTTFYSIKYPANWELDTTGLMESSFVLFAPIKSKKDAFRENISFLVQEVDEKKMGLTEYTELTEKQIIDRLAQSVILKSTRSKTGDLECHTLVYTGLHYLKPLKYLRKHWVIGNKAYALSFTCEEQDYDKFEPLVTEIFNSFELKLK